MTVAHRYFVLNLTAGGWFGYGADPPLQLEDTLFKDNTAACCYATGYGTNLPGNSTLTCADTDSGENQAKCCYGNQYSDGSSCVTCEQGTDCSVIGTSLATQSLVSGYWRASSTSTDVRSCWFADACSGNTNATQVTAGIADDCTTTTSFSRYNSSEFSNGDNILVEDSEGCDDVANTNTATSSIAQVDVTTYCAKGYRGPCKYYAIRYDTA
jgi:hypothetical protein